MPDSKDLLELHKEHTAKQEKLTYFLLAAAASGIAFAVNKTEGLRISWSLLPVGGATLCWAVSFFFGYKQLERVQIALQANYNYLRLLLSQNEGDANEQANAMSRAQKAQFENIEKAQFYNKWQFRLLIIGALLFIIWRVLEMIRRSSSA
ncbi:MAG: hypothetical protein HY646_07360 [Acidobacteria bacterium]|nr:hypothetical protein [Acidobacteriota bacterium]